MRCSLITCINGQDGSYLAVFLLGKVYEVYGIKRRSSLFNTQRNDQIYQNQHVENRRSKLRYGDLSNSCDFTRVHSDIEPDEVFFSGTKPMFVHINIGSGCKITIKELAETIKDVDGFKDEIIFNQK